MIEHPFVPNPWGHDVCDRKVEEGGALRLCGGKRAEHESAFGACHGFLPGAFICPRCGVSKEKHPPIEVKPTFSGEDDVEYFF